MKLSSYSKPVLFILLVATSMYTIANSEHLRAVNIDSKTSASTSPLEERNTQLVKILNTTSKNVYGVGTTVANIKTKNGETKKTIISHYKIPTFDSPEPANTPMQQQTSIMGQGIQVPQEICEKPAHEEAKKVIIPSKSEFNSSRLLDDIYARQNVPETNEDTSQQDSASLENDDISTENTPANQNTNSSGDNSTTPSPILTGSGSDQTIPHRNIGSIAKSLQKSIDFGSGKEMVKRASSRMREIETKNQEDQNLLTQNFINQTPEELSENLETAESYLAKNLRLIEAKNQRIKEEKDRYRAVFLNAFDKTKHAKEFLASFAKDSFQKASQPFSQLFQPKKPRKLAQAEVVEEIFGKQNALQSASSSDALVDRTLMLAALPEKKRNETLKKLNLVENVSIQLPNGKKEELSFLHSGYFFGGGRSAVDCSSFVTSLLPIELRKSSLTTMDFYGIYRYLTEGKLPHPPKWQNNRDLHIKNMALSFRPVNLYKGEPLIPGDLLVSRLITKNAGHIFIVQDFNPKNATATVIEASQTSGTINTREFPLSLDSVTAKVRYFRPGLFALRLSTRPKACSYSVADLRRKR